MTPWSAGRRIGGYVLLREIARGGMGEIWLALDRSGVQLERLVVIKRVLRASDDDPQHVTLFLDEARIASQLQHPNVVQVFTMGEVDGAPYLVMEYLPGQSLGRVARAFRAHGTLVPLELAARIIADAARGLGYAHRRKGLDGRPLRIVHRDVSPQNVLVTYDGHVKVLDFGIAVAEGRMSKTATGVVRGKIAYMAPEQASGAPLSASADVFALGVLLWELTTGKRLHGEADDLAVLRTLAFETAPLPDVRSVDATIDPDFAAIVAKALHRQPLLRFADGAELSDALEAWLARHPPKAALGFAMEQIFGAEIAALPDLQRAVAVTPSVGMAREMPEGTKTTPALPPLAAAPPVPPKPPGGRALRATLVGFVAVAAVGVGLLLLREGVTAPVAQDAGVSEPVASREGRPPPVEGPVDAGVAVTEERPTASELAERLVRLRSAEPEQRAALDEFEAALRDTRTREDRLALENRLLAFELAAPERSKRARPGPGSPRPALGAITLDSEPWTRVFLGKKLLGETPLVEVLLPAGTQRLHLVNEADGVDTWVDVKVTAGQTTTKQYRLR